MDEPIKELTEMYGMNHCNISSYNPRTNGAVERIKSNVENVLKKKIDEAIHLWLE